MLYILPVTTDESFLSTLYFWNKWKKYKKQIEKKGIQMFCLLLLHWEHKQNIHMP